jgi:hypothetical protein
MIRSIVCDGQEIEFKKIEFSDGSSNFKLLVEPSFSVDRYYSIAVDPSTPGDAVLWEVLLCLTTQTPASLAEPLRINYAKHGIGLKR